MNYDKTNWQTGDTITAEKLNKLEQGVHDAAEGGGGTLYVSFTVTDSEGTVVVTTDAVFADVAAAVSAGKNVIAKISLGEGQPALCFPLTVVSPAETPTVLIFAGVLSLSGEWAEPTYHALSFTASGCALDTAELAVAQTVAQDDT